MIHAVLMQLHNAANHITGCEFSPRKGASSAHFALIELPTVVSPLQ